MGVIWFLAGWKEKLYNGPGFFPGAAIPRELAVLTPWWRRGKAAWVPVCSVTYAKSLHFTQPQLPFCKMEHYKCPPNVGAREKHP